MHVSATRISEWARSRTAQGELPRLIRKLIHSSGARPSHVDFPAGDSISNPGWDGEVVAGEETPWVPAGHSCWELSCEGNSTGAVTRKANSDYEKRTAETPAEERSRAIYVALTARKWTTKKKWVKEKTTEGDWGRVVAYDANDLEQWLEQGGSAALWLSELLGITGPGIESCRAFWSRWSRLSDPPITSEALHFDRAANCDHLVRKITADSDDQSTRFISVKADGADEAIAFACVAVISQEAVESKSAVVTDVNGWSYVATNPGIDVVLVSDSEIAESAPNRSGLVIIIPCGAGGSGLLSSLENRERPTCQIEIERPRAAEFEKALIGLGLDQAEADRFTRSCGRSWTVFRRLRSVNSATRKPKWLIETQSRALSLVCLLGAWKGGKEADRNAVSCVASRPYEDVERDLRILSQMDDAPILEIGDVWLAKSPLELLVHFGDRITSGEIDRFLELTEQILESPDPVLELPEEERHSASLFDKVRPESGHLIKAVCDSLVKLSVHGPEIKSLSTAGIAPRIEALVRRLLLGADETRWLSLSSCLRSLAEAAPDSFLVAVEQSLDSADQSVIRLLTESGDSGAITGQCWHADLLWALEVLSWSPKYVRSSARVLARLSHVEIRGNWGNNPRSSLYGILRSWMPQTASSIEQRISILDDLLEFDEEIAIGMLHSLAKSGMEHAFPAERPKWRDWGTGAGYFVSRGEIWKMTEAATDRLLDASRGNFERVARLLDRMDRLSVDRRNDVVALIKELSLQNPTDEECETLRARIRTRLRELRSLRDQSSSSAKSEIRALEDLYEKLCPGDPIVRFRWLFSESHPSFPAGAGVRDHERYSKTLTNRRKQALAEILGQQGHEGLLKLARACPGEPWVGVILGLLDPDPDDVAALIVANGNEFSIDDPFSPTIRGILRAAPPSNRERVITAVLEESESAGWESSRIANLFALASPNHDTWKIVEGRQPEVVRRFWETTPVAWLSSGDSDSEYVVRRLLDHDRPRSALEAIRFNIETVPTPLLLEALERFVEGREPDGRIPDPRTLRNAIERLESSPSPDRMGMVRLEFRLIPALGFDGQQCATLLYEELMNEPSMFAELICLAFKPHSQENPRELTESEKSAAQVAWEVLHHCRCLPGTKPDGSIDQSAFSSFFEESRALCVKWDRAEIADQILGQILAHAPSDADGNWPCLPVRDVLDAPWAGEVRTGFSVGVRNQRGMTSREYWEGGDQERSLAAKYKDLASAIRDSHSVAASVLDEIADSYDREGEWEDNWAKLRLER